MMTHGESRQRRVEIASAITEGDNRADVARRFNVTPSWVRQACYEHGVKCPRQKYSVGVNSFRVLAGLRDGKTLEAVGKDVALTTERVRQIKDEAVEYGVLEWVDKRPGRR